MKPRVCIFAAETLLHWSGYYVRAFRTCCDVIVIGRAIDPTNHDYPDWERVAPYVVENDIHCAGDNALERVGMLPAGWKPDLVVSIQSGEAAMREVAQLGCPTVCISVDTWHDPREFQHAYQYDFVFLAQKGLIKYMRRMGCCRVFWLPLACDPVYHYGAEGIPVAHDISFVGSTHFYTNRQRRARLKVLESNFQVGRYFGLGAAEMATAYGQSRMIFNASIACDVNMRVFEALATGHPLVTNREAEKNGLFELFEDGVHLISYDDEDLVSQVRRYLEDPVAAQAIGEAGRREVLAHHTYAHRVDELFAILRAHHVDIGRTSSLRIRQSGQIRDLISPGSLRVLDIGLGLHASRIAMHRRGVEHVAGVALDDAGLHRRAKSYDAIWTVDTWPAPTGDYDTAIWTIPGRCGASIEEMIASSREWLLEGGRVLFFIEEEELQGMAGGLAPSALTAWLLGKGCQFLMNCRSVEGVPFHLIMASLVTMNVDEVNRDLYREFPANGVDTRPWEGVKPDPERDSPDAEGP